MVVVVAIEVMCKKLGCSCGCGDRDNGCKKLGCSCGCGDRGNGDSEGSGGSGGDDSKHVSMIFSSNKQLFNGVSIGLV